MKSKSPILDGAQQRMSSDKLTGTLGDKERVTVDGEPGTVIDSPTRDSYIVKLDNGETVHRLRAEIERMQPKGDKITTSPKAANVQPLKPELDDEPRHTPGPWTQINGNISGKWETGKAVGIAIVGTTRFCGDDSGGPEDIRMRAEDKANARLIAAAPELLRALQTYGGCEGGFCSCPMENPNARDDLHSTQCRDARNAIARAKSR